MRQLNGSHGRMADWVLELRSVVVSLSLSRRCHCFSWFCWRLQQTPCGASMEPQSQLLLRGYTPGGDVCWIMNSWAVLPAVGWCVLAYLCHSVLHELLPLLVSNNPERATCESVWQVTLVNCISGSNACCTMEISLANSRADRSSSRGTFIKSHSDVCTEHLGMQETETRPSHSVRSSPIKFSSQYSFLSYNFWNNCLNLTVMRDMMPNGS